MASNSHEKRLDSNLDVDISEGDQATIAQSVHNSSDEEFVADASQQSHDRDEFDATFQEISDFEYQEGAQPASRPRNKRSWIPNATKTYNEVQPYPTDPSQKWTRTYVGPVKRWTRLSYLLDYWFGDENDRQKIFNKFWHLWWQFELLPPRLSPGSHQLESAKRSWMPENFDQIQEDRFHTWYRRYLGIRTLSQTSTLIDKAKAYRWFLPQVEGEMSVLLGHVSDQKEYFIKQGESIPFSDAGFPIEDIDNPEPRNGGWLLDVGGIVLSMEWMPINGQVDQLLAMTVIPYSDQAFYKDLDDAPKASDLKAGAVQIWKFKVEKDAEGIIRPARSSPKLVHALCSSWGRVTQLRWSPVPLAVGDQVAFLAMLCDDGRLRILEIKQDSVSDDKGIFRELQEPMITLEPPKEHTLEINCFTWINMNRIAVALSDGSVAVCSLSPCQQLQRHPVHSSPIMDIVSGYPSHPFIIATMPMGGVFTLTDLNRPTAEKTYHGNPLVSLQPNVLAWNNHLKGFASIWPSSFPGTSTVSFVQSRVFPLSRHICTVEGQTTCLAFGTCHPFLLLGSSDGSVWALNVMRKITSHRQKTHKVKLFQHEYYSPMPSDTVDEDDSQPRSRGVCRILHGFLPQVNFHPLGTRVAKESKVKRARAEMRASKKMLEKIEDDDDYEDIPDADEESFTMVPGPIAVQEPLTRITALSWNPNADFSWWAAAAMGSGLVRIMDLGIENTDKEDPKEGEQAEESFEVEADGTGEINDDHDEPSFEEEGEKDVDENEVGDGDVEMMESD